MATEVIWDGNADANLFIAVLAQLQESLDIEIIAGRLGCTTKAVEERIKKLKKQAAGYGDHSQATSSKRKKAAHSATASKKRRATSSEATRSLRRSRHPTKERVEGATDLGDEADFEDGLLVSIDEDEEETGFVDMEVD